MSRFKGTPGPWIAHMVQDIDEDGPTLSSSYTGEFFREIDGLHVEYVNFSTPQNARAIAAVPEMIAALEYLIGECDEDMDEDYNPHAAPLAKARAALDAATKEETE